MRRFIVTIISLSLLIMAVQCSRPGEQGSKQDAQKTEAKKEDGKKPTDSNENKKSEDKETEAVPVQVVSPSKGDISSFLLFSSNIDSEKTVDIYPMTTGIIEAINFDEGQEVKKGDILAVLDDREATINEQKAEVNYKNLKAEFQRQKEIYEQKMISKDQFEKLKYSVETAELEWKHMKLMLSYTRITTPISGVVTKRYIKVGNRINTSELSFSVVQDKEKIAVINIPEQEMRALFVKQRTVIFSGERKVDGVVKRISPSIDPESGTFKVTVDVNDKTGTFAVGQFVNVKVIKKVHKNVILLTKDAIVYEGGNVFVFIVNKDNEAHKKSIKLGFEEGNRVEVTEGLNPGEKVVTAGKSSLKNKSIVKIVEPIIR